MDKRIIKSMGLILKEETVAPISLPQNGKYLILESAEPFPGYHGTNLPEIYHPESYFIVTKLKYKDEKVIRTIMATQKNFPFNFDGAPGAITFRQENYNIIRVRNIKSVNLSELLDAFQNHGLELMKNKKINNVTAMLKIRKFYGIKEVTEGIFEDLDQKSFSYLEIPYNLSWKAFKKMTINLKYNMDDNNFDAALGHIFYERGVMDFVRIYDMNSSLKKLTFIRDKYLEYISKL